MTQAAAVCPRCGHLIPDDDHAGQYPGALSRVDDATEICSPCGLDEAFQQVQGRPLTPRSEWPVA